VILIFTVTPNQESVSEMKNEKTSYTGKHSLYNSSAGNYADIGITLKKQEFL
jgi:hypothetical protein